MNRTRTVTAVLTAAAVVATVTGCSDDPRRDDVRTADVLSAIADGVIVPAYEALVVDLEALDAATGATCEAPSTDGLEEVRAAWTDVELAWQSTRAMAVGPVVDLRSMTAIAFTVDPEKVERLLAPTSTEPLDEAALGGRGSDQRGIYGVEVALFATGSDDLAAVSDGQARRCAYVRSATALATTAARELLDAWTASPDPYRDTFVEGMEGDAASSVEEIVSQLSHQLQEVDDMGVRSLAEAESYEELPLSRKEGPARHGIARLRGALGGVAALVLGPDGEPGLADLVANASEDTAERLEDLVQETLEAFGALPASSEEAISDDGLRAAADAVAALRVVLTTEVASQLGVTIGFSDADGDS